jgi:hypothetical protein
MKVCEIEDCDRKVLAKNVCKRHYYQLYYQRTKKPKIKEKKDRVVTTPTIGICMFCGSEFLKRRKDKRCCNIKCLHKLYARGWSYQPGTKEEMRGEVMIILAKWKWKMTDELLVFRTIHSYLLLCGSCEEHIMSKEIDKVIPHCLRELKALYLS